MNKYFLNILKEDRSFMTIYLINIIYSILNWYYTKKMQFDKNSNKETKIF